MLVQAQRRIDALDEAYPAMGASRRADRERLEAQREFHDACRVAREHLAHTSYVRLTADVPEFRGDVELMTFAAKLILYIGLSAKYEMRTYSVIQRLNRETRKKRHRALLDKYDVQPDWWSRQWNL